MAYIYCLKTNFYFRDSPDTPNLVNPFYPVHPIPILIFNLRHLRNLREPFFHSPLTSRVETPC